MKKKLLAFGLGLTLTLSSITPAFAVSVSEVKAITVKLNNNEIDFDQTPLIEDGHTLVPFRAILEEMGISVEWDNQTKTITCKKDDKTVSLTIGSKEININGEKKSLDVPAKVVNGRTLVPLRAISESFDADVDWDNETKTVSIKTKDFSENEPTEDTTSETAVENAESTSTLDIDDFFKYGYSVTEKFTYLSDNINLLDKESVERLDKLYDLVDEILGNFDKDEFMKLPQEKIDEYTNKMRKYEKEILDICKKNEINFLNVEPLEKENLFVVEFNQALKKIITLNDCFNLATDSLSEEDNKEFSKIMEDFAKYYNNLKNNINKIYNQYEVDNYTKKLNSYVEQLLNIAKENKLDIFLIDIEYYSDTMYILNKILKSIESKKDTLDSKEKEIYESLKKEMLDFMDSNEKLINEHIDNKTEKNYYDFEETQNIINDAAKKYEEYAKQLLEFAEKNNIKILND